MFLDAYTMILALKISSTYSVEPHISTHVSSESNIKDRHNNTDERVYDKELVV